MIFLAFSSSTSKERDYSICVQETQLQSTSKCDKTRSLTKILDLFPYLLENNSLRLYQKVFNT